MKKAKELKGLNCSSFSAKYKSPSKTDNSRIDFSLENKSTSVGSSGVNRPKGFEA